MTRPFPKPGASPRTPDPADARCPRTPDGLTFSPSGVRGPGSGGAPVSGSPYETECHRMQYPVGPPPHPPMPAVPPPPPGPEATGHFPSAGAAQAVAEAAATAAVAVLLIGPAGAGKTTVARHWADTRRVPTAHVSLDDVREWVRSGFADPQSGWNDHSEAQYRLARRTCGFAARNFLANGISCILDDAVFPDRPVVGLGGWKRHVGPGLLPVVLLPGLEVVLERNAERTGNRRLSDEEVARIHGRMAGWYGSGLPIIDNSQQDVATTARLLDEVVARSLTGR
nr:AAA family ATPase [Streptomyces cinnamoneus]